ALCSAARRHFGSWRAACQAAGLRPYSRPRQRAEAEERRLARLRAAKETARARLAWLRARPHLRARLRLFAMAVQRGYDMTGGAGSWGNPFSQLNPGARPRLRGAVAHG